jgi:ABC-type multidrug transport system fused ATPase/permease subunit
MFIFEVLAGIRTVAAFNAQPFEIGRYDKHLLEGRKWGTRKSFYIGIFSGLNQLVLYMLMGISWWYVTYLIVDGNDAAITSATVFCVFWSIVTGMVRLGFALPQFTVIQAAKLAAGEIFDVIDRVLVAV